MRINYTFRFSRVCFETSCFVLRSFCHVTKGVFKAETERCQRVSVGVEVDKRKLGKTKAIVIFASQGIYGEQSGPKTRWAIVSDRSYVHE